MLPLFVPAVTLCGGLDAKANLPYYLARETNMSMRLEELTKILRSKNAGAFAVALSVGLGK